MTASVSFWRSAGLSLLILAILLGAWEIAVMPKAGGAGPALDPEYAALLGQAAAQGGTTPMPGPSAIFARLLELLADPFYVRGPNDQGIGVQIAYSLLRVGAGFGLAAIVAIPLGFMGARNVVTVTLLRFSFRRVLDGMRGVDQLIWALAFVRAVGLGPLAGVLAIFVSDIGILSKLYAEAIENAEKRQAEGVTAAGAGRLLGIRFGILPQVAPVMLAQALYFFESNTRSASILGVVGAGGIGLQIAERIRVRHWDEVAFIIILMIITVAAIDWISGRIRRRLITA
jgi:phosphonate ABC transporter permease subunit PhnE